MFEKPMLAQIVDSPFDDECYIWEVKYDGARCIADVNPQGHRLYSRSGRDMTVNFPEIVPRTRVSARLDGEIICRDPSGKPIFNYIQHRTTRQNHIQSYSIQYPAIFQVFDILSANGRDLKGSPLKLRKMMLEKVLIPTTEVVLTDIHASGTQLYAHQKSLGWEGVVGKTLSGLYLPGKRHWLKKRVPMKDWFYVCGYTAGTGWRTSTFGSLVLGKTNGTSMLHVGSVGTGFDVSKINELYQKMKSLPTVPCPFGIPPEPATWIKPEMKVIIEFAEYTNDGKLRFPSFKGEV